MSENTTGAVFVLINDGRDEKASIVDPDIYGPFVDDEAAVQFIAQHPYFEPGLDNIRALASGYAAALIVSARTAIDPESVLGGWAEWRADGAEAAFGQGPIRIVLPE